MAQNSVPRSQKPEARSQKAEGRRQKAEGRRQKAEGRRQKAEGRRQKAEGRRQKAEGRRQKAEGRRQKAEGRRQKAEGSVYTPYRPVIRHCIRRRRSSADAVRFGTKSVSESVIFRKHTHTVQAAMSMGIMERPRRRHMLLRIQHNHEPECTFNEIAPLAV